MFSIANVRQRFLKINIETGIYYSQLAIISLMKNIVLGFHTNEEEMEWMMSDKGREAFVELTIRAIKKVV